MSIPTAKLFLPAAVDISNYNISASVQGASPCIATYVLEFPFKPYCDPEGGQTCAPETTQTITATEGVSSYGFAYSADQPYIVSETPVTYPELASQVCTAVPSASEVVCHLIATITLPGGELSTSPAAQSQTFNSTMYDIPITANADVLSKTSGSCAGQVAQTSSSAAARASSSSSASNPSSASSSKSAATSMSVISSSSTNSTPSSKSTAPRTSASNIGLKLVALLLATSLSTVWLA